MARTTTNNLYNSMHDYKLMNPIYSKISNSNMFQRTNLDKTQLNTFMGYLLNSQIDNLENYNNKIYEKPESAKSNLYKSLSTLYSSLLNGTGLLDITIDSHNKIYQSCDSLAIDNPFKITNKEIRSEYFNYIEQTPVELCAKNIQWINRIAKVAKYSRNDCIYKYCNGDNEKMNKFFHVYKKLLTQVPEPGKEPILDTFLSDYSNCIANNKEPDMKAYSSITRILNNNITKDLQIDPKYKDKYDDKYLLDTFYSFVSNEYALERLYELKHAHTITMLKEYTNNKEFYDKKGYSIFNVETPEKRNFENVLYVDIPEYITPFSFHLENVCFEKIKEEINLEIENSPEKAPPFRTTLVYKMPKENQKNLAKIAYNPNILNTLPGKIINAINYYKSTGLAQGGLDLLKAEKTKKETPNEKSKPKTTTFNNKQIKNNFENSVKVKSTNNKNNNNLSKKQKRLQSHKERFYDGDER